MSDGDHQPSYKHPKIAKHTTSKLPDAFLKSKGTVIVPKKLQKQKISKDPTSAPMATIQDKDLALKKKKRRESKNPFLSMNKVGKQMQRLIQEAKAMQQEIAFYNVGLKMHSQRKIEKIQKIKYQDFITLTPVSKKQTSSLKKILHIPTLTVYYLRECLINIAIDKLELQEWITNCNKGGHKGKILDVFWNMPEGYYSLIYEYQEGVLMETLLDNLNTLPLPVIQDIAIFHFTSNISIYNSQIIIDVGKDGGGLPQIYYLPIYQETPPLIRSQKLQEIMQEQIDDEGEEGKPSDQTLILDRKIIWRLGIILLASFVGEDFVRSDMLKVQSPLSKCCLLHTLIQQQGSLTNLYLLENSLFDQGQHLISFLCHLLSSKNSPTYTRSLKQLKKHKFLTNKFESVVTLKELIQTMFLIDLQDEHYALGQLGSEHKLHKIVDIIGLSLQNINQKLKIDFSLQNPNIQFIANELGMKNKADKLGKCLKQLYQKESKLLLGSN